MTETYPNARTLAVVADCHIHPPRVAFPEGALEAMKGCDLIITLGDMGETSGLEQLAAIAPVLGVLGADDQPDPRTAPKARVVEAGGLRFGCVFDPVVNGLAATKEPFAWAPDSEAAETWLFGGGIDVLLHASTHIAAVEPDGRAVNPGSLTLPSDGQGAFALIEIAGGKAAARIVRV
jgi:putative phosphoesterase